MLVLVPFQHRDMSENKVLRGVTHLHPTNQDMSKCFLFKLLPV